MNSIQINGKIDELMARQRELIETQDGDGAAEEVAKLEGRIESLRELLAETLETEHKEFAELKAKAVEVGDSPTAPAKGRYFMSMPYGKEFAIRATLQAGSGSGSYLVPQEWHDTVESVRFAMAVMRTAGARVVRTSSTHNIPVLTATGTAAIKAESAAYQTGDPTISQVVLSAYKLTHKVDVTEELLEDADYDVDAMLAEETGTAFGLAEDGYYLVGTGSSQPTGIFAKTADKTTASATAITKDELIELVYALPREYRGGSGLFMHEATALYIAKLKVDVTTSGSTPYWWTDAVGGEPPKLLGYPVYTSSSIATIAAGAKTVCFGNPRYYVIGERGPLVTKRLQLSEYADTFAFRQRVDGQPLTTSAFAVMAQAAA